MAKAIKKRSGKAGLPPGSLVYVGEKDAAKLKAAIYEYSEQSFEELVTSLPEECLTPANKPVARWIKVDGIHDIEGLGKLGECFNLHPLTIEDILNTDQRPKLEDFDHYLYIVMKMLSWDEENNRVIAEQVSIVLMSGIIISFQEGEADIFRPLIERLRTGKGRIRKMGADYLAYALLDAVVDNYFLILEKMGEKLEYLEEEVAAKPKPETLAAIHGLRREMVLLRRSVWPLEQVVNNLVLEDSPLIREPSRLYFKDVHDHLIQATDTIETSREILTEMSTLYLSAVSNRLNEVMKVLTIIATIFMPLTFIAGVYGMNFANMPELHWKWGYPLVMLLMLVTALSMLVSFRKRKWL
ncbi:MAG: magnesium/cobalt transporter CorA [Syntrophobacteraceae bacterium]